MNVKKLILIFNILILTIATGCSSTNLDVDNNTLDVRGLTLKMSLIQTAYEVYNVNIKNPDIYNKELYDEFGKDSSKHYDWIKETFNEMDDDIKNKLNSIFTTNTNWDYTYSTLSLDDDAKIDEVINTIVNDDNLDLSLSLKNDIDIFFNNFYDNFFKSYYKKNKNKFNKKSNDINEALKSNDVDVIKFMENSSGIEFKTPPKSIFYYNFNPVLSQEFEYNDVSVSTIQPYTSTRDILSIPFHDYSHALFSTFTKSSDFLSLCKDLENDESLKNTYNKKYKDIYSFDEWCEENLIEGFSKYLDYKYYKGIYEYSKYVYDLDFYNYLKEVGFNPNKLSLKEVSINFLKTKLNKDN